MSCKTRFAPSGKVASGTSPNGAIAQGAEIYVIDADRCTECVGHFDAPQCRTVCPVDCIPLDPDFVETKDQLFAKYLRLAAEKKLAAGG